MTSRSTGRGRAAMVATVLGTAVAFSCSSERFERGDERNRLNDTVNARVAALDLGPDAAAGRLLTLAECERIAIANNLEYRTGLLQTQLADEQVRAAMNGFLPRGSVVFTAKERSNEPLIQSTAGVAAFEDKTTEKFSLATVIPVFDFGATWAAWQIATDERVRDRLTVLRARQTLVRDVRVAYVRCAGTARDAVLAQQAVAAMSESLRTARTYQREGLTAVSDTAVFDAGLAQAIQDASSAANDALLTRAQLARTLSIPVWTAFAVDPGVLDTPASRPSSETAAVRELEQRALLQRPELFAQDYARNVAAARIRQAFAAFFPRIGLTLDFDWSSNSRQINPSFLTGGVAIAHDLLDSGNTLYRYRAAEVQADVEKERSLLIGMGVIYEVDLRLLETLRADDLLTAQQRVVTTQRLLLEQTRGRHREGLESAAELARVTADHSGALRGLNRAHVASLVAAHELAASVADSTDPPPLAAAEDLRAPAPDAPRVESSEATESNKPEAAASRPGENKP